MAITRRHTDIFADNEYGDFVVRKRIPPMWQLVMLFTLCFAVLFLVAVNAESLGGAIGVGLAIFAVIGPLSWFTVYFNQRNGDMVLAAEFQNALFSAAARLKTKFCLIVKKDGTVFYFDRGFQKIFPDSALRGTLMLDKIFNNKMLPPGEAEKLDRAMDNNQSTMVFMYLPDENGVEQKLIINVDVLPRPKGFFILRGRDYIVKQYERTQATALPANPSQDGLVSAAIFHMLHTQPYGAYTTDADGNFTFVNYRLESWLGFSQGEVMSQKKSLADILMQPNTEIVDELLLKNCEGEILFRAKQGAPLKLHMRQEIVKDASGAVLGSVAFIRADAPINAVTRSAEAEAATGANATPSMSLTQNRSF